MGDTKIQWTDKSWNPLSGCEAVSPGCANCYAARLAATRLSEQPRYLNLAHLNESGRGVWSGQVNLHHDKLREPMTWRKPVKVFVADMSDLFHEDVPDDFLDLVFETILHCPRHTFQILTKRPARMRQYVRMVHNATLEELASGRTGQTVFPPANCWFGVSVENQQTADERIPLLLQTPAAIRFLSVEPLLESVDISEWLDGQIRFNPGPGAAYNLQPPGLSWVICGGESGPHARPCHVEWLRAVVQQCRQAGVACFVKQLGSNVRTDGVSEPGQRWPAGMERGREDQGDGTFRVFLDNPKGGSPIEWPEDLRVRQFPEGSS